MNYSIVRSTHVKAKWSVLGSQSWRRGLLSSWIVGFISSMFPFCLCPLMNYQAIFASHWLALMISRAYYTPGLKNLTLDSSCLTFCFWQPCSTQLILCFMMLILICRPHVMGINVRDTRNWKSHKLKDVSGGMLGGMHQDNTIIHSQQWQQNDR